MVGLRGGAALLIAAALLIGWPVSAAAHAELVASVPIDGAVLGVTPGAVLLSFNQQLNPRLSEATVVDPAGDAVTAAPASARLIQVDLHSNLPGTYHVTWTAVSLLDGHTTHGILTFTVDTSQSAAVTSASSGPSANEVIVTAARWIEDLALILAIGSLFILWLSRREDPLRWVTPSLVLVFGIALASGIVVVSGETIAAAGLDPHRVLTYLTTDLAGAARVARVLLEALACITVARRPALVWPVVAGIVVALAASGHAAASSALGIALDSGHVLTAGVWVGGIMALATLRPPGGWRAGGQTLLARFTPWALAAFLATVALGFIQAVLNVGTVSALVTTTYGRVLIAKSAAVLLLIPLSVIAWRRRSAHLRIEAAIGATVVLAASMLAAFPLPVESVSGSNAVELTADAGLPHGSELTLGAQAGQTLVGVTVDPARPGTNELTLYVLSADGSAASSALAVSAAIGGRTIQLQSCGDTCRRGSVQLAGKDAVSIHVGGSNGGTASVTLPALPAPDGTALLDAALARMRALSSVSLHETLTSGTGLPTFVTDYEEVAPDRLAWTEPDGAAVINIGTAFYFRSGLHAAWVAQSGHDPVTEPTFAWQFFPAATAVHAMGSASIDGLQATVVDFFAGEPGTPVWFRFYIDAQDRVLLSDMLAPGHFMTQSFADFDAPLTITLP